MATIQEIVYVCIAVIILIITFVCFILTISPTADWGLRKAKSNQLLSFLFIVSLTNQIVSLSSYSTWKVAGEVETITIIGQICLYVGGALVIAGQDEMLKSYIWNTPLFVTESLIRKLQIVWVLLSLLTSLVVILKPDPALTSLCKIIEMVYIAIGLVHETFHTLLVLASMRQYNLISLRLHETISRLSDSNSVDKSVASFAPETAYSARWLVNSLHALYATAALMLLMDYAAFSIYICAVLLNDRSLFSLAGSVACFHLISISLLFKCIRHVSNMVQSRNHQATERRALNGSQDQEDPAEFDRKDSIDGPSDEVLSDKALQ
ncbi:hypothetical protein HDV03_001905 [Kappamyces sp. JEL0829]|nr:hypothetical protein HDV03_001905 [Kappamyces sp. JEL0829]